MSIQRTAVTAVTLVLTATVLAGCVSPTPEPPPPTAEEIKAIRDARAQAWWDSFSTGTTMPDIEVIEMLPGEEAFLRQTECLEAAEVPGVTVYGPGEWTYNGAVGDDTTGLEAQLQYWECVQQFPAEDDFGWMLSPAQTEWLYDFYVARHIPCLRTFGLEVLHFPTREAFLERSDGYPAWLPFPETMRPTPRSSEWTLIAKHCPLPEMVLDYGLPGYTAEP